MSDIVIGARAILNEGCGYIFATSGQIWTQEDQDAVNNGKKMTGPPAQTEKTKAYGGQWIGKHVYDCSGLWVALMAQWGAYVYHGSNTIWKQYCRDKGEIEFGRKQGGGEIKPGTAVFLYRKSDDNRHHIGVYIGGGKCIEAKGTYYGVVESDISHWDEWGEIKGIDYGGGEVNYPVVKRGCKGAEVKTVQALLNGWGYSLDVDGSFGKMTEDAVKAFQQRMGLKPDGIVGDQTWAALTSAEEKPEVPDEPDEYLEIVNPVNGQTGKISMSAARELHDALRAAGIR
jgi:hypothetical protein